MTCEYEALREAVARAICLTQCATPDMSLTDPGYTPAWTLHLEQADAALRVVRSALREPSDGMWDAGRSQLSAGEGVLAIWRAMFAASALGGGNE